MATVAAAYPFVSVSVDTSALQPVAQRSPGVIAVVGASNAGASAANTPTQVESAADVAAAFGPNSPLAGALGLALLQDPKPSTVYGVKLKSAQDADVVAALDTLAALDDVDFVSLAQTTTPATLVRLKEHVEQASAAGQTRVGVAMIDPAKAKSTTYVQEVIDSIHSSAAGSVDLMSSVSRMIVVAARGALTSDGKAADVATAAMAAIAGFAPASSIVLKRVRGFSIPREAQYTGTEIKALSEANINPIIQPALLVGSSLVFGEGRCFTSDASVLYVDVRRLLDDLSFQLKAGLIGLVGNARVTRAGLTTVKTTVEGILGPLKRAGVIDDFTVRIPVLDILSLPDSARTADENTLVVTARANRAVDLLTGVTLGPNFHTLRVTLQPEF